MPCLPLPPERKARDRENTALRRTKKPVQCRKIIVPLFSRHRQGTGPAPAARKRYAMIYTITLDEMEFKAYHGCYDLEKLVGNRFLVSISLDAELDEAAHADDVTKTINYLRVYAIVAECMKQKSDILENVTLRIIEALYAEFPPAPPCPRDGIQSSLPPLGGKIRKVSVTLCR